MIATETHHQDVLSAKSSQRLFLASEPPSVADLQPFLERSASREQYPLAKSIEKNIPIYDMTQHVDRSSDNDFVTKLQEEWYRVLIDGPGIIVLEGLYGPDHYGKTVDAANVAFKKILDEQNSKSDIPSDQPQNGRAWNVFRKLAETDPVTFVDYFSNPWLAYLSETWLGPAYRVTSQMNIVRPSGKAQPAHRDYHMGYFPPEQCIKYPRAIQTASQLFTLQGAVAHSDMPLESGPTRFLPYSQTFEPGYMAHRRQEFQAYFLGKYVSLPLKKGDAVFFNPAVFHGAGENVTTDFHRHAHLLQLNSCFVKPMEAIDSVPIVESCWNILKERYVADGGFSTRVNHLIQAMAEGHPFPSNMDRRMGVENEFGMATEQSLLIDALKEGWDRQKLISLLKENKMQQRDGTA